MKIAKYHSKDLSGLKFLVTGGAGFVGSNIVDYLLKNKAGKVIALDNFSTGSRENIEEFLKFPAFELIEGDIREFGTCLKACKNADYVLHQAALGSVPRSINDPITTNNVNITGTLNIFLAAKDCNVKRIVYAASSSTYGDSKELPKVEERIGKPISPYGVTKYVNELYAKVCAELYGLNLIGLRYFNVYGPRQNPHGAYAAVIPLFIQAVINDKQPVIFGDGKQTRDFTFVQDVVQANILALFTDNKEALNQVFNVAEGKQTTVNQLWEFAKNQNGSSVIPKYSQKRIGDIHDSLADISKAINLLNYKPIYDIEAGMKITYHWFAKKMKTVS